MQPMAQQADSHVGGLHNMVRFATPSFNVYTHSARYLIVEENNNIIKKYTSKCLLVYCYRIFRTIQCVMVMTLSLYMVLQPQPWKTPTHDIDSEMLEKKCRHEVFLFAAGSAGLDPESHQGLRGDGNRRRVWAMLVSILSQLHLL